MRRSQPNYGIEQMWAQGVRCNCDHHARMRSVCKYELGRTRDRIFSLGYEHGAAGKPFLYGVWWWQVIARYRLMWYYRAGHAAGERAARSTPLVLDTAKLENWRGFGATKYHVLAAVHDGAQTVSAIRRSTERYGLCLNPSVVATTLAHAKRGGLVEREGERRHYHYRLTQDGLNLVIAVRKRFTTRDLPATAPAESARILGRRGSSGARGAG